MASDDGVSDLVELRPAPAVLLRHRDAELDVVTAPRTGPRVTLHKGALWIRAGEEGPGVTVTHGAASVQLRAGAGVVEVHDVEALLVVASGRAAVKGVSPLPRSVIAGQAVTLTLDGTFTDPDALSAAELAADRMVVENLALDSLASTATGAPEPVAASAVAPVATLGPAAAAPAPVVEEETPDEEGPEALPTRIPGATTEARIDPPRAPLVERTDDPFAPRVRPEGEAPTTPPAPVGRPAPALPHEEPSALEMALHNVGVTDAPVDPITGRVPAEVPTPPPADDTEDPAPAVAWTDPRQAKREPRPKREKKPKAKKEPKAKKGPKGSAPAAPEAPSPTRAAADADEDRRRHRILIYLVIGAVIILGIVTAVVFTADSGSSAALAGAPLLGLRLSPR
jgi:hypothetical protein